jgi:probable rRNA maturation factor
MGAVEVVVRHPAGRRLAPGCRALLLRLRRATRRGRAGVVLLLASDATVRRLNRVFLGEDRITDVLSFPAGDVRPRGGGFLGEIAVAVPRAARQARRAGWGLREETALLVVHGFLHLLGHDHERDDGLMRRLEERLLRRAGGVLLDRRRLAWGVPDPARRSGGAARRGSA